MRLRGVLVVVGALLLVISGIAGMAAPFSNATDATLQKSDRRTVNGASGFVPDRETGLTIDRDSGFTVDQAAEFTAGAEFVGNGSAPENGNTADSGGDSQWNESDRRAAGPSNFDDKTSVNSVLATGTEQSDRDGSNSSRLFGGLSGLVGGQDTDSDGLTDDREQELGINPVLNDTDGDGLGDEQELTLDTDPGDADTDDDGLQDAGEIQLGLSATEADTDGDGLGDGHELALGTDPTAVDSDGDGLKDGWEYRNRTPEGVALPESDPLAKDLYVQIDYAAGVRSNDEGFYRALEREFAEMPIRNPDNTTGIDLHVREGGQLNASVSYTGDNFWQLKRQYYRSRLGNRAGIYHHTMVVRFGGTGVGYGEIGGEFAVVAAGTDNVTRKNVVVHELLHNVVGEIESRRACRDDPAHYCADGWLQHHISHPEDEFLPVPIARQLQRDGFED